MTESYFYIMDQSLGLGHLMDAWIDRADFLERLAGFSNEDIPKAFNQAQATVLRECVRELNQVIQAIHDQAQYPKGKEMIQTGSP